MKTLKIILITFLIIFNIKSVHRKFVIGQHGPNGFFSIFLSALNKLVWCKKNNHTPVIHWDKNCLYYEARYGKNAWNYYFKPVSKLNYHEPDFIYTIYKAPDGFSIPFWRGACYDKKFHETKFMLHQVVKEYVKIKQDIKDKINKFYFDLMKDKLTIGIHLRGTDKKYEATPVDPLSIFKQANKIAKVHKKSEYQFFVATDEERLLDLAKKHLNGNVIYYNSHRSKNGLPIHKTHKAILGEEILIEAKLLSKCDYFLHTRSNVATAVMIFNPYIENFYFEN